VRFTETLLYFAPSRTLLFGALGRGIVPRVSSSATAVPIPHKDSALPEIPIELNARFRGPLLSFFTRRTKDHALAQDLTQETLLRVFAAGQLRQVDEPESYVFTVATNLLRDQRRFQARRGPVSFVPLDNDLGNELEQHLVEELSPERVLLSRDSLRDVLCTLDELGERTRNIFVLFRLERMKQREIAALYGIGLSTVEKHVMRATLHLARRYGDR
jgi:RNA polymerase sigma-70 factor (ECF subfamily)